MDSLSANIVQIASTNSQNSLRVAVATAVLKKAMDMEGSTALQLLAAVPPAAGGDALEMRGTRLDTFA
jgi:hypothetical protein